MNFNQANRSRDADRKKGSEMIRHINFDARRISKSILNEILCGIIYKVNQMPPAPPRNIKIKRILRQQEIMPEPKPEPEPKQKNESNPLNEPSSMTSLIVWNISKALEMEPCLDLKVSIRAAMQRLDSATNDLSNVNEEHPEQQHLVCALLAWQQLGHHDADSLHRFIESKKIEMLCDDRRVSKANNDNKYQNSIHESNKSTNVSRDPATWKVPFPLVDGSFGSYTSGPVVKLPMETKIIMRCENEPSCRQGPKRPPKRSEKTMNKIDAACCLDTVCVEKLATLDSATNELRARTSQLARREAERVELLERAEAAWRDLERGYQRRLVLAGEKEDDLKKLIEKCITDRTCFKKTCSNLTNSMKNIEVVMENARAHLTTVEKQVCDLASTRMQLSEEAAKGEACLAEQLCKAAQFDRDLKFKEEQARRKLELLESEADSARALTCEAERAMRAELAGLREQITQVSKELLQEDEANVKIKKEHDELRKEKAELIQDLEGCKEICDKKMQGQLDELMKKKEKVLELQEQALECRCKLPVDQIVQVKRTPSLAAMCRCAPEDHILESCSCTSLRGRILTNLLADLFGGLQHELSGTGSQMPCQLLKCLEDKHNWDRSSPTKTNLRNFFSNLLKSELDIAIASSIENYHAKWVGATCADVAKMKPTLDDDLKEGWQERAIERRAHKMATRLAEDLFQERSEQIEQRAKDIMKSGPPPCECGPPMPQAAAYACMMPTNTPFNHGKLAVNRQASIKDGQATPPAFWKQTIQDVTKLKHQIEDLAKDSLKKEDLKLMEKNIFKIVTQASVIETEDPLYIPNDTSEFYGESVKKGTNILRITNRDIMSPKSSNQNKLESIRRKGLDNKSFAKKSFINEKPSKQSKKPVHGRSYAVNLCLCGTQKNSKMVQNAQLNNSARSVWKQRPVKDVMTDSSNIKQTKPININLLTSELPQNDSIISEVCRSNCKCFHRMPSNTSIDELLKTLASWKYDLAGPRQKCIDPTKSSLSKSSKTAVKDTDIDQNNSKINYSFSIANNNKQDNESVSYEDTHIKTNKQHRPFGQPATTESEYIGTVYLDKSHENICKCVTNIENNKDSNQENYEGGNKNIPFQLINTNACECKIHQEMVKDNKKSQTEELQKVEVQSNHCQVVQSKDFPEIDTSSKSIKYEYVSSQQEIKKKSDDNDVPQKSELFSSIGEHYISFLGVTLNDVSSIKKTRRKLKAVDHNVGELLIPKGNFVERPKKLPKKFQKKLTEIEQFNVLTNPKLKTMETNDQFEFNDIKKCECLAKFEEFKSFMDNLINKSHKITYKDEVIDSQSLEYNINTIESCDCCNNANMDNSKDLEVNAFHLLEDHIKGRLEEFKLFSGKSQCLLPEEEAKLFSTIIQRVKQVISDCANKIKCGCAGEFPNNGSWNRAYGLLQEYLKIKIQRVQCLCVSNDSKDVLLPEILEKVCNLIENDFQRLKDICQCRNSNETRTKVPSRGDLVLFSKELPEKDTNTSQAKYNDVEVENLCFFTKSSKQNSNNSMILRENISSQVPPNLGMESKSCDIMRPYDKNARTTETDYIVTNSKSNGVMYNTCDCCYNTDKVDIRKFPDMFGTKEVFVNLYTEQAINTNDLCEFPKVGITQEPSRCLSKDRVASTMKLKPTKIEINKNDKSKLDAPNQVDVQTPHVPYIGYTVDCSCNGALGGCFCVKSVVQANNDKINSLWKGYLVNNNNNQDFSYIMHGTQKENSTSIPDDVLIDKTATAPVQNDDRPVVLMENIDEIILKYSLENVNYNHHAVNTVDESLSSGTSYSNYTEISPVDWIKCPVPVNSGRSNAVKLTNSIYFPGLPVNNNRSPMTGTVMDHDAQKPSQICDCNKVPICHVKMLVEHIEKNLIESKCTCDSLIAKVCPVHSKRVF